MRARQYVMNISWEDGDNIVASYETKAEMRRNWKQDLAWYVRERVSSDDWTVYVQIFYTPDLSDEPNECRICDVMPGQTPLMVQEMVRRTA
jgi:hypothetical protein